MQLNYTSLPLLIVILNFKTQINMLLPSAAVRAALKLNTPEKRYAWAAEQLFGSLVASPAVVADTALGVPAKAAIKGIAEPKSPIANWSRFFDATGTFNYFSSYFYLPFDIAQYNRGVPLLRCIGQLTADTCLPYIGTVPAGDPILDNATSKTVEQYLVEQAANIIAAAGANFNFSDNTFKIAKDSYQVGEFEHRLVHYFELQMIFNRTPMVNNDRYSGIGSFDPMQAMDFGIVKPSKQIN